MIEAVDTKAKGLRTPRVAEAAAVGDFLRRLDWLLMLAVAALVAYGLWVIDGITWSDPGGSQMGRQATFAVGGSVLFLAALVVDPDVYRRRKKAIYVGTLGVMAFVLVAGAAARGSRRCVKKASWLLVPATWCTTCG